MEQEIKNKISQKKTIYIIIGVVVVLFVGKSLIGGLGSSRNSMSGYGFGKNINGSKTFSNKDVSVTVGGNKLPDNWPSDAPKYRNGTIVYSGSSNPQDGESALSVMFTTKDSAQAVADFYKQSLVSNGWKIEESVVMGASTIMSAKKDTRTFSIIISDGGNGEVSVSANVLLSK